MADSDMNQAGANDEERELSTQTSAHVVNHANDTTMGFSREAAAQLSALDSDISAAEQEAIAALPSGSALLIVRRGPNAGARFLLDTDVTTVGRHPDADIFLDDVTVSRKHAEFVREGDSFVVRDIGSLNGTYVNRGRIDAATLVTGDEVQIGKFRLTFHASPQSPAQWGAGTPAP